MPAPKPITTADEASTNPAAGVIATRPATAPAAAPSTLGRPSRIQVAVNQVIAPIAAAVLVTTKALAARPFAPTALPALKPNQPNQRSPAPRTVYVRLCGSIFSVLKPTRRPTTSAATRAATPEEMCTTVPPAKSSEPRSNSQPSLDHTQWAIGE